MDHALLGSAGPPRLHGLESDRQHSARTAREFSAMASQDDSRSADVQSYSNADHPKSMLEGLNDLRGDAVFCDVILRVGEQTFPAHKCVLVSLSPYFKAMFTSQLKESQEREVTLKDIEPTILETLLHYFYTGTVGITQANVQSLMAASNLFQVLWVREACAQFMEKYMDASNCLGVRRFAENMNCEWLQEVANEFVLRNLPDVSGHEEFLNLSLAKLVELVSSDELDVPREEDVFTAVLNWLNHQLEARKGSFHTVLESVRLPLMSPSFLYNCVSKQEVVRTSPECQALLQEALLYQLVPAQRGEMQGARTQPRANNKLVDVIVCAGGRGGQPFFYVQAFDLASNQWTSLCDLPFAVHQHGAVVTGNNVLYIAGGLTGNGSSSGSNRLLRFDPQLNKWENMANMSCARPEVGMAVLDGFIYIYGCDTGGGSNIFARYNTETNTWEQLPTPGRTFTSAVILVHDGCLYVAGGRRDGHYGGNLLMRFDPRAGAWTNMSQTRTSRCDYAGCVLDGKLYIIGGLDLHGRTMNRMDCYDIRRGEWRECSPMRVRRARTAAAVMGSHIYVLGGTADGAHHDSVERYMPATDRWEDVSEMAMTTPRSSATSTVLRVPKSLLASGKQ